jgi:hypothetical protein
VPVIVADHRVDVCQIAEGSPIAAGALLSLLNSIVGGVLVLMA